MTVIPTIVVGTSNGASYTTNNGTSWSTFGSGAAVVPSRQPSGAILAMFADGTLRSTTATLYTFPAAASAFFVNPANPSRITIGLVNGDIWRSVDGGTTWSFLATFGTRISQVFEAADGLLTYVAVDTTVWLSRRAFTDTPTPWTQFSGAILTTRLVLGAWGNYVGASDGTVKNVDTGAVLAGPTSAITGMAYNPRHGTLWVAEQSGKFWRMRQGDSSLSNLSTIPSGGGRLSPITPIPGTILTANDAGAWMSPDAGVTWRKLLAGAASGAGYYSTPVPGTY
jgi:hypothetical protein